MGLGEFSAILHTAYNHPHILCLLSSSPESLYTILPSCIKKASSLAENQRHCKKENTHVFVATFLQKGH